MLAKSLVLLAFLAATPGAYAAADLRTTIAASPASQQVYATTRYTVTVKNWGNKKASTNGVTIQLPPTHTSPQVYVLGTLVAKHANCSLVGTTTLDCTIPNLNANASSSVWFDLQLPVNAAPIVISATITPPTSHACPVLIAVTPSASCVRAEREAADGEEPLAGQHPVRLGVLRPDLAAQIVGSGVAGVVASGLLPRRPQRIGLAHHLLVVGNGVQLDGRQVLPPEVHAAPLARNARRALSVNAHFSSLSRSNQHTPARPGAFSATHRHISRTHCA